MVLEKTLESPLDCKEIQLVHPKGDQSWVFIGRTDVEAETPILWPPDAKSCLIWRRPRCWESLKAGREGDDRWWYGWMASLTQWRLIWVNSGSCWWTGTPGVLRFMGSQRVRHDWATELNWTELKLMQHVFDICHNLSVNFPHCRWGRWRKKTTTKHWEYWERQCNTYKICFQFLIYYLIRHWLRLE